MNNLIKMKTIFNYLLLVGIIAVSFTACEKDDDTEVVQTAEEIAAEELEEFHSLIGTGIGGYDFETAIAFEGYSTLSDDDIDKLNFIEGAQDDDYVFISFKNNEYAIDLSNLIGVAADSTLVKSDTGFTAIFKEFEVVDNSDDESSAFMKIEYNTETDMVYVFIDGYIEGTYLATFIWRFTAAAFTQPTETAKLAKTQNSTMAKITASATLSGIYYANVKLEAQALYQNYILQTFMLPYADHYIKLTDLANGDKQIQFCDSSGNVSGDDKDTDYYYDTSNHFWANKMPMALNLKDVNFTYNSSTGIISDGTIVDASARENDNPDGFTPPFIDFTTQDSDSSASIISTSGNTSTSFTIEIDLGFEEDVHCIITY